MAGSSLAWDGIAWAKVSKALDQRILTWGVGGSSPSEWQALQGGVADAQATYLIISPYDMNEHILCDFRADLVPLPLAVQQLWHSPVDSHFWKRVLSAYPLRYVRKLFPTAGRSQGVLTGLRQELRQLAGLSESEAGLSLQFTQDRGAHLKITDWTPDRALRRLASMRSACEGRQSFEGPKKLALRCMLQRASRQGQVFVVVLPVSPMYAGEFLSSDVLQRFEAELSELKLIAPAARWVRLDRMPTLASNAYYSDLVHMNGRGQEIATAALLQELSPTSSSDLHATSR